MKNNKLLRALLVLLVFAGVSCSRDDTPGDPGETVTLNMLNEQNGKTLLGTSDVYINKANNFYSRSCFIAELGKTGGLGEETPPRLGNLVGEVAVIPEHAYQVFDGETLREFPSGTKAVMVGAAYYRLYVVSPVTVDNQVTGAVVKYVPVLPETRGLPGFDHKIGEVYNSGETISLRLPKGAECFWYDGVPEEFDLSVRDGILRMTLRRTPSEYNGVAGDYGVYIRSGEVFTRVIARVVR